MAHRPDVLVAALPGGGDLRDVDPAEAVRAGIQQGEGIDESEPVDPPAG
jgi:hypothetical protein